jgi:hypothetical protein
MKYLSISAFAIVALLGVAGPLAAYERGCEPGGASCGNGEHVCSPGEPDERNLTRHCCYVNAYGKEVHAPAGTANGERPLHATARCRDGCYSFSEHASGTCSSHHRVEIWFKRL